MLDGDWLRKLARGQGQRYSRADRVDLGIRYGRICKNISARGLNVVIATIAMYQEVHDWRKALLPNCCAIFLDVPLEELRRRDPKQIYARYFRKELTNVAGLDLPTDDPPSPDIHIRWREGMDRDKVWSMLQAGVESYISGHRDHARKGRHRLAVKLHRRDARRTPAHCHARISGNCMNGDFS